MGSFFDAYMKNKPVTASSKTFKDERAEAEANAIEFENKRKVQASKFQNLVVSSEDHPGFKAEVTDEPKITQKASSFITAKIGELVGKGGLKVEAKEYRTTASHNDKIDDSIITDKAMIHFACTFATPRKPKVAHFVVSYDLNNHDQFKLEEKFYTEAEKDVVLTRENLNSYISEKEEVKVKASKPIAYFNADVGTYDTIETVEDSSKVVSRLASLGYEVDSSYWIDASYDPKKFGKLVHLITVPYEKTAEFKKIAAMSDDEWFNRADEKHAASPYKGKNNLDWFDRASEKGAADDGGVFGYDKKEYKDDKKWIDRALSTDKDKNFNSKEMYRDEALKAEASKTEAPKEEAKPANPTLEKIAELEKLLN